MNQSNEYKAQWMQNLVPKTEFIDQKKKNKTSHR